MERMQTQKSRRRYRASNCGALARVVFERPRYSRLDALPPLPVRFRSSLVDLRGKGPESARSLHLSVRYRVTKEIDIATKQVKLRILN